MIAKKTPAKKARHAVKPKTGRPQAVVDPKLVENLASIGCTLSEVAAACNCSKDTIERRFATEMAKGRENGKTRLRKKQLEVALAGNVVMLIWLGKQMLGQSEQITQHTEHSGEIKAGRLSGEEKKALSDWVKGIQAEVRATAGTE